MNLFMLVEITRPDYYEEKEPVGIFDSHEGVLAAKERLVHNNLFSNWFDLTPPDEYAGKNVAKWKECETYKIEAIEINTYEFGGW